MNLVFVFALLLLLLAAGRAENQVFHGSGCPFFIDIRNIELLWRDSSPCKGNPVCHDACYQVSAGFFPFPNGFKALLKYALYGSLTTSNLSPDDSNLVCLGFKNVALYAAQYPVLTNVPGSSDASGDSFAGYDCWDNGQLADNDPFAVSPNNFCQACTHSARAWYCSGNGIVPFKNTALNLFNSISPVCLCDYGLYGYASGLYREQCNLDIRYSVCFGHGQPPAGTRYNANQPSAGIPCVCDIGYGGPRCATNTGCPCGPLTGLQGSCLLGATTCVCKAGFDGVNNKYCCPVTTHGICNGHGTCMPGGICACDLGFGALPACFPQSAAYGDTAGLPCTDDITKEVLGTLNNATGTCSCFGDPDTAGSHHQIGFKTSALGTCNSFCPHTTGSTSVQCANHGKCDINNDRSLFRRTCVCDAVTGITDSIVVFRADTGIVITEGDIATQGTGLCCPAWPGTGQSSDIGNEAKYVVCGGRGVCSAATGACVWNSGRVDPYGCPINPGQTAVCAGQTCRRDGVCVCNTGTTNLAGPTCQINVACNPSDTSAECKNGGTCTTYATVTKCINDLGFVDDPKTTNRFGSGATGATISDDGQLNLVKFLFTRFAHYNATHSAFNKGTFWKHYQTLCTGLSHSACLEATVTDFASSNGVQQGRALFASDAAYIADVLNRLYPTITQPGSTWRTAFSVGLSAGATNTDRLNSITRGMCYQRFYDYDTQTAPAFSTTSQVLCNCTVTPGKAQVLGVAANGAQFVISPAVPAIGRGGLQCQGSCPVGLLNGQTCNGFDNGVHNGHCLASGVCECDVLRTGTDCGQSRLPCFNTSIIPNTPCNGRSDAQCSPNAAGVYQCKCPMGWKGNYCELTACAVPAAATYAQTLVECSGFGTCSSPNAAVVVACSCDVSGQLAALGTAATLTNKPRLPYGAACEFNGIDDCGVFVETNPIAHTGVWRECNGHGTCRRNTLNTGGNCTCAVGFVGRRCTAEICSPSCNVRQLCNVNLGLCACRKMWTGANCTQSRCSHGVPDTAGTACVCDGGWSVNPSTGLCTVPACSPTFIDPILGTQKCTGSEPICASSAQYHAGGCCRSVCTLCTFNATISSQPFCVCGNSLLQIQTQGICKDRCGGGVAEIVNGAVDCDCTKVQTAIGLNRFIGDSSTCGSIQSCQNGGIASGQSCSCVNGFTGPLCQYQPCDHGTFDPGLGICVCKLPYTIGIPGALLLSTWGTATAPCSQSLCSVPWLNGVGAFGATVPRTRPSLTLAALGSDIHFQPSGFECICRDNEICLNVPSPDLMQLATLLDPLSAQYYLTPQQYAREACVGGCQPIVNGMSGWIADVNNAIEEVDGARQFCAQLSDDRHYVSDYRRPQTFPKNHTVWCNCTDVGIHNRTGMFCYDYACQNGGVLKQTAFVNGQCQCPWGTEKDLKDADPVYLATANRTDADNRTCACRFRTRPGQIMKVQTCAYQDFPPFFGYFPDKFGVAWGAPHCGQGKQECVCPFAYDGTYCEHLRCNSQHGHASHDRSRCICNAGWTGPLCTVASVGASTGIDLTPSSSSSSSSSTGTANSSTATGNGTEAAGVGKPTKTQAAVAASVAAMGVIGSAAALGVYAYGGAAAIASTVAATTATATATASTASTALSIARTGLAVGQAVAPVATGTVTAGTTTTALRGVLGVV